MYLKARGQKIATSFIDSELLPHDIGLNTSLRSYGPKTALVTRYQVTWPYIRKKVKFLVRVMVMIRGLVSVIVRVRVECKCFDLSVRAI